eukprot:3866643-Heterocapsa_arctica.AAC.1
MLKNGSWILPESRTTTATGNPTAAEDQLAPRPRKLPCPRTCTLRPEKNMARDTYVLLEPEDLYNSPDS